MAAPANSETYKGVTAKDFVAAKWILGEELQSIKDISNALYIAFPLKLLEPETTCFPAVRRAGTQLSNVRLSALTHHIHDLIVVPIIGESIRLLKEKTEQDHEAVTHALAAFGQAYATGREPLISETYKKIAAKACRRFLKYTGDQQVNPDSALVVRSGCRENFRRRFAGRMKKVFKNEQPAHWRALLDNGRTTADALTAIGMPLKPTPGIKNYAGTVAEIMQQDVFNTLTALAEHPFENVMSNRTAWINAVAAETIREPFDPRRSYARATPPLPSS